MTPSGLVRRLSITILVLLLAPAAAFSKSFWVSASGGRSCTHSTLQAAIDEAQSNTDEDVIHLVGGGPFTGPFSILGGGGLTIVGGVPGCGATTSGQYATLLAPAGQRPLSILMSETGRITLQRLVITTKAAALKGTGGGIWFAGPSFRSELVLDDSQVVENSCLSDGGGIFVSAGSLILTGRALVRSNTAVDGGGISAVNGALIKIDDAIVTANTAVLDGGGIHAPDAAVRIGEASGAGLIAAVANNRAGRDGGGIYVGAAASAANLGVETPAIILGNQAQRGGGIFLEDAVLYLFRAAINQNTATGEGGGILATSGAGITTGAINMLLVDGVPRFSGNQAGDGAALFADGALTEITLGAGSFLDHDTEGAVMAARGGASLSLRGITVSGNQASELFAAEGGAALTLRHVSVAGNDVSRLVRWDGTSPGVQVAASAFSETEPFFAGLPTPQELPQLACIVSHSPLLLAGMPPGTDLSQVVVADPRFMGPEHGDLHAWPGSPVVDLCTVSGGGIDRDADLRGFDEPFRPTPEGQTHDAGADEVVPVGWDDFESGTLSQWSRVESPAPGSGNSVQATTAARLGPLTSQYGLELTIVDPTVQSAFPAYVSAEQSTSNQSRLDGSFFIDPQSLTMASTPGLKPLRLITFRDGIGFSRPRLTFGLERPAADKWFLEVAFWPDPLSFLPTVAGSAFFACAGTPCGDPADWRNNRIDFEWRGGDPGHLTMWRTRYLNGVPDAAGRVQMLSVDLPMQYAEINEINVGTQGAAFQPGGSSGRIYLDEISFTR